MSVTQEEHDHLTIRQLRERREAMNRQRSVRAELSRIGDTLNGLSMALKNERLSTEQVKNYLGSLKTSGLLDTSKLAEEIDEYEVRAKRITELDSALSDYL